MSFAIQAIAAAIAIAQSPAPIVQGPLTVDQAADIAARNAFSVQIQASRVEQARQGVNVAKAGLLPRVNGSFTESRLPQSQTANFGGAPVVIQGSQNRTIGGSIQFPIDVFGNVQRQVDANRAGYRASRTTLIATRNDARLNARTAFYSVLRAEAAANVAAQAVVDADERLRQAKTLLSGQQIAEVDVTRLEAQLDAAKADKAVADNTLQITKNAFNVTLARPVETPVELVQDAAKPTITTPVDDLVKVAQGSRPEVQALQANLQALANTRRALEGGLNPSLAFGVNYSRNLDAGAFAQKEQTAISLNVSVPIFDGGATRARVRSARQDEQQAQINLNQTELVISQEVRNATTSMLNANARLASAEAQRTAAEEVYRLAKVRQDAGEGTYVEVVDAFTNLVQARNAAINARFDYLVAYAQLQRAVGSDDLTGAPVPAAGS